MLNASLTQATDSSRLTGASPDMCPKPTRAATLVLLLAVLAPMSAAAAWPFGGDAKKAPPTATAPTTPAPARPADPPPAPPVKATAEQRVQAQRLDPVARVAFWTREVAADPNDVEAGVALATALRQLGRVAEASEAASQVLAAHPDHPAALMEFAKAQVSLDRGFYAIAPLKKAAALAPADYRPWSLLGIAYEQNEQPDLARAAYEQALRIAPDMPQALSNYAVFRATHGEAEAAEAMLRKAVASPNAGPAERQNLALVLGLQGKMAEAERLIRQDLPPEVADQNLAYLRGLNAQPAAARSYSAVKASEAAMTKAPS